jgi:hypothetical protein
MEIFNKIFNHVNNDYIKTKQKDYPIFFSYFNDNYYEFTYHKQLNWYDAITFKYNIFKNYYHHNTFDMYDRTNIITMLYNVNKIIIPLHKFKNQLKKKCRKYKGDQIDFNFNVLDENNKNTILIIENKNNYLFNIFDLIKLVCSALAFEEDFFIDPKYIKNPWNNMKFSSSNIYNIYFFIKKSNITMPYIITRYFQSNLCLTAFANENQSIIKQYIIHNWNNFDKQRITYYILDMIYYYNQFCLFHYIINIDPLYTPDYLIKIFNPYIKLYLSSVYMYETELRQQYKKQLIEKLTILKKQNPFFGVRFTCNNIVKLYLISQLKYKHNQIFFTNLYIPTCDMIFINYKCFLIEFDERYNNPYTLFPSVNQTTSVFIEKKINVLELNNYITDYKFTNNQIEIINNNYIDILCSINNNISTQDYIDNI